jgi:nitrate reductase gamma subunit
MNLAPRSSPFLRHSDTSRGPPMNRFFFGIFPYLCLAVFVVGHFWRYRYDKFGWTTRVRASSMRTSCCASAARSSTSACSASSAATSSACSSRSRGPTRSACRARPTTCSPWSAAFPPASQPSSVWPSWSIGAAPPARSSAPPPNNDKAMYAVLGTVIVLGIWNTIAGSWLQFGGHYNYRDGVSPWFRSIFEIAPRCRPDGRGAPGASRSTRCWPSCSSRCGPSLGSCTSSAPRSATSPGPYIVYRSRDARARGTGGRSAAPQGTWDKPGAQSHPDERQVDDPRTMASAANSAEQQEQVFDLVRRSATIC